MQSDEACVYERLEIRDSGLKSFPQLDLRLPAEGFLGIADVGLALLWVVVRKGMEFQLRRAVDHL